MSNFQGGIQSTDNVLYVGDLDPSVSEELFWKQFQKFGNIKSFRIHRDHQQRAKCGFVTYRDAQSAIYAQNQMNNQKILERNIRVNISKSKEELNRIKANNLFIKSIESQVTQKELENFLSQYGKVASIKICTDGEKSRGYGYISFEKEEDSNKVLELSKEGELKLPQTQQNLIISKFKKERDEIKNNLYIRNFGTEISEEDCADKEKVNQLCEELKSKLLKEYEEEKKIGKISSIKVMIDEKKTRKPYAFICFEEQSQAEKLFNLLSEQDKDSVFFYTSRKRAKQIGRTQIDERYIYVKNIKLDITEQQFKENYSRYGDIASCKLTNPGTTSIKPNCKPTQYGIIIYKKVEEAMNALSKYTEHLNIENFFDNQVYNSTTICLPKEEREKFRKCKSNTNKGLSMINPKGQGFDKGAQSYNYQTIFPNFQIGPMGPMPPNQFPGQPRMPFNGGRMMNDQFRQNPRVRQQGYGNKQQFNRPYNQPQNRQGGQGGQGGQGQQGQRNYQQNRPPYQQNMQGQQGQVQNTPQQGQQPMQGGNLRQGQNVPQQNQPRPQEQQPQLPGQQPQQGNAPQFTMDNLKNNLKDFLNLPQDQQRNILGQIIFPKVNAITVDKQNAPKITGMLIDFEVFEVGDILELLDNAKDLEDRVTEAEELIISQAKQ